MLQEIDYLNKNKKFLIKIPLLYNWDLLTLIKNTTLVPNKICNHIKINLISKHQTQGLMLIELLGTKNKNKNDYDYFNI